MKKRQLVLFLALLTALCVAAPAATLNFSHTWDGSETSGTERMFRDGVPSLWNAPKSYPGALGNVPTYFALWSFSATPGTIVTVTPTVEDTSSFLALYDTTFNPVTFGTGYVADQGSSLVTSIFSALAPASGQMVLVAMSLGGSGAVGHSVAGDISYTASAVPEPASMALLGLGLSALALGRKFRRR